MLGFSTQHPTVSCGTERPHLPPLGPAGVTKSSPGMADCHETPFPAVRFDSEIGATSITYVCHTRPTPVEPAVVPIIENRIEEAHRALEAGAVKCPIWNTPALEEPTDRDGRLVDSSRAGGKYFIAGTAEAVLESHDDHVKARLTSWMIEQRRPENPCPEIDTGTISEAQQRPDPGIPERSDGILRYLETRSDVLGKTVTYNPRPPSLLYDKSFHTLSDEEKEYFRLLAQVVSQGWWKIGELA